MSSTNAMPTPAERRRETAEMRRREIYDEGYDDAIDEAIRLVREKLGDRVVNGVWQAGDPRADELVQALQQEKA
jgi:hypothetical protein